MTKWTEFPKSQTFLLKLGRSTERNQTLKIKIGHIANLDGIETLNSNSVQCALPADASLLLEPGKASLAFPEEL